MSNVVPLPVVVRIGPFDYTVEDWDVRLAQVANRFGECDRQNHIIRIRRDVPPQRIAEVLLHEVLHAAWDAGACEDEDGEERIVSALAMAMTQVWRDNPHLIAFVSDMMTPRA